jgi:hypothetical protein
MAQNSAPDARVRLSAEGVAEVVNAFKRVQQEAQRTSTVAKKSGDGLGYLSKKLESVKSLLPTIAAGAAITGLVAMTKNALEAADGMGKLSQKTGLAVGTISTLSFAARTADVEQEALNKGLVKFTRAMDEYDKGAATSRDSVQSLFGSAKALAGLDQDTRLLKTVDALSKLAPGAKRTGLAMQFFGKAGADLLPLIDDLGNGGFEELRKKAEKLGLVVDEKLAKAAQRANDSMRDLESAGKGMALQFASGLAPELADVAETITDSINVGGQNGLQKVGEGVGKVVKTIVAGFEIVGKTIGFILSEAEQAWDHFGDYARDVLTGIAQAEVKHPILSALPGGGIAAAIIEAKNAKPGENQFLDRLKAAVEDAQKSVSDLFKSGSTTLKKPKGKADNSEDTAANEKAKQAALALAQAEQDAEARVAAAELKAQDAAEKQKYEQGLISLQEYYDNRIKMAQNQGDKEAAALYQKIVDLQNAPLGKDELPEERQAKVAKAAADFQVQLLENAATVKQLQADQAKEAEALNQKALDFEKKIQAAQGDRYAAAKAQIDAEANQLDEILRKEGVAADVRAERTGAYRTAGYQQVDFSQLQNQANTALDTIAQKRDSIDAQVQSGQMFAFQGEQQILAMEQQRLPLLQQIADAMKATAVTPEQVQAAADFQSKVDQLAISSNKAALEAANFKQNLDSALKSDLSNWLTQGIDQAESLGDAFRGLALSVVDSLRQIASQMLATYMIQKLLGFVGMGTSTASPAPVKAATGGLILGAGTGTSDSIPARLSNYEYVVRSSVVRRPGVLPLLNMLNYGSPMLRRRGGNRFAEGGLVDAPSASGDRSAGLAATFDLDHVLLLKRLEASPEFDRVIVRTIQNNSKAANRALGNG